MMKHMIRMSGAWWQNGAISHYCNLQMIFRKFIVDIQTQVNKKEKVIESKVKFSWVFCKSSVHTKYCRFSPLLILTISSSLPHICFHFVCLYTLTHPSNPIEIFLPNASHWKEKGVVVLVSCPHCFSLCVPFIFSRSAHFPFVTRKGTTSLPLPPPLPSAIQNAFS